MDNHHHHHHKTEHHDNDTGSSPVDALCRDLRRQYGAAAGTTLLPPLVVMANDTTDMEMTSQYVSTDAALLLFMQADLPEPLLQTSTSTSTVCECHAKATARRQSSMSHNNSTHASSTPSSPMPLMRRNSLQRTDTCPHCGGGGRGLRKSATTFSLRRAHSRSVSPTAVVHTATTTTTTANPMTTTTTTTASTMEEPAHVRHFLQDTPQLRYLRSALDMNAAEPSLRLFGAAPGAHVPEYRAVRAEWARHTRAASELANLLFTLSHEMSLEDYGAVESKVFSRIFAMIHGRRSMAGLAALTALLEAPSADEERRCIKFAYTLSQALRNGAGDFEFLQATAIALGRMAQLASNVDFGRYY